MLDALTKREEECRSHNHMAFCFPLYFYHHVCHSRKKETICTASLRFSHLHILYSVSLLRALSFPSVFSLVIPVFLLSWFVCLLASPQPKLTGWVHILLCSLSAAAAAIKAALMATTPCVTCTSHSGRLMDTLLLRSLLLPLPVQCRSVSFYLLPTPATCLYFSNTKPVKL